MSRSCGRALAAVALLAATLFVSACGSSGSGTVDPPIQGSFLPERSTPEPASVSLAQSAAFNDLVTVQARVTDVAGLYGAAFYLIVDPAIVTFVGHAPGQVLEAGGQSPVYLVDASQPGVVVVSASRLGAVPAVDVTGTGILLSLTFRVVDVGTGSVAFQGAALYGDQLQPQPMPGIQWYGGAFVGG